MLEPSIHAKIRSIRCRPENGEPRSRCQELADAAEAVTYLPGHALPVGSADAARELRAEVLLAPSRFTTDVTIAALCKMIVDVGRLRSYQRAEEEAFASEEARKRPAPRGYHGKRDRSPVQRG